VTDEIAYGAYFSRCTEAKWGVIEIHNAATSLFAGKSTRDAPGEFVELLHRNGEGRDF
jgi:hypothetical protein